MMKEEFEARFGMEVTGEVYERVEKLYMESSDDKDTFVRKIKRQNTVVKLQNDIISEMSATIRKTERHLIRSKAEADKTYHRYGDLDGESRKDYEKARDLLGEGSRDYYAYNNYLMSLEKSVTCSYALEILQGRA